MAEMICRKALEYPPGKAHKPGDRFEVEEAHVQVLKAAGFAEDPGWDGWPKSESPAPRTRRKEQTSVAA